MQVFLEVLKVPYFYTLATNKRRVGWASFCIETGRATPAGLVMKRCVLGAIVLAVVPKSESDMIGVLPGSLVLEMNGVSVLFETYRSIHAKLDRCPRPIALRLLSDGAVVDVVFWDRDPGLVLCGACDLAVVESVASEGSAAWQIGSLVVVN